MQSPTPSTFIQDIIGMSLEPGIAAIFDRKFVFADQPAPRDVRQPAPAPTPAPGIGLVARICALGRSGHSVVQIGSQLRAAGFSVTDPQIVHALQGNAIELVKHNKGPVTPDLLAQWRAEFAGGKSPQQIADAHQYSIRTVGDYLTGRRSLSGGEPCSTK